MWSYIQPQLSAEESCSDPHGVKPFACKICDLTFNHSCQLKSHVATHMEWRHLHVKYVMQHSFTVVTWRVMKRPTWSEGICMWDMWCNIHPQLSLEESWRDLHGEKAFACEICDATFIHSCHLKSHLETHMEWSHLHVKYVILHSTTVVSLRVM